MEVDNIAKAAESQRVEYNKQRENSSMLRGSCLVIYTNYWKCMLGKKIVSSLKLRSKCIIATIIFLFKSLVDYFFNLVTSYFKQDPHMVLRSQWGHDYMHLLTE